VSAASATSETTDAPRTGGETSLRERKKSATRQAIEDAAWALFAERGYEATSINDIAARADVAPRTFFRYFPTKEAVLYGDLDEALERFAVTFRARPTDEPVLESLIASVETMAAAFQKDRKRMIQRFEIQHRATTGAEPGEYARELVYELVMEREQGQPDCELRARLVTGLLTMVQSVANDYWLAHGGDDDLHEVGTHCVALLSRMLLGDQRS
jgi:TetR/AcrR family transcriptional regulator, regulator of mycofactocin system